MTERRALLLDVDTGIDDSLALLYAAASPEVDIVAVTCVAGNVGGRQVAENTRSLLELAGRDDIPVALGAEAPLVKPLVTTEETHGPLGVGHAALPPSRVPLAPEHGADLIVRLARQRPRAIHLVTLGPMTNLALALQREPRLPSLVAGWTFMGGAFTVPGNTTPTSEWNIHVDPDAARLCLEEWAKALGDDPTIPRPLGMGLDATEKARMLPAHVAAMARRAGATEEDAATVAERMEATGTVAANRVMRAIVDALRFYFEFHQAYDGFYGAFIHDPFVVASTADRTLVRTEPVFVDVEPGPGLGHAMTVADWRHVLGRPPNVDVAVDGDAAAFMARLIDRVGRLAGTRSDLPA